MPTENEQIPGTISSLDRAGQLTGQELLEVVQGGLNVQTTIEEIAQRVPDAYDIAVSEGFVGTRQQWLESLRGTDGTNGVNGVDGLSAYQVAVSGGYVGTQTQWLNSLRGTNGLSAYEIAVAGGFSGTEAQWLASLRGVDGTNGQSAYEIAVANGFVGTQVQWLQTLRGADGTNGTNGINGTNGLSAYQVAQQNGFVGTEAQWLESLNGADGQDGTDGQDGKSAYEIAVELGYTGTQSEWLQSLRGPAGNDGADGIDGVNGTNGLSAYQVAVSNGFIGTEIEWLESLNGSDGADGLSAYQVAQQNGFIGTQAQWLQSLRGADGADGTNGLSAYDVAVLNGFSGTENEWLVSLRGPEGKSNYDLAVEAGFTGTLQDFVATMNGVKGDTGDTGADGKSAYQVALDNGFVGTESQWLASLQGPAGVDGADGTNGLSAYQIAVAGGFVGTETQWLQSLRGTNGTDGSDGESAYQVAVNNGFVGTEVEWLESLKGSEGITEQLDGQLVFTAEGINAHTSTFNGVTEYSDRYRSSFSDVKVLSDYETPFALTEFMRSSSSINASPLDSVIYIDPVNGSDANTGTNRQQPRRTRPSLVTNTAYLVKGGETLQVGTDRVDIAVPGIVIGSYDSELYGKATLDGTSITNERTRTIRVGANNFTLTDIAIKPPAGDGASRQAFTADQTAAGLNVLGVDFVCDAETGIPAKAIALNGCPHFVIEGCETKGFWVVSVSIAALTTPDETNTFRTLGTEQRTSFIRYNKFFVNAQSATYAPDNDCITLGGSTVESVWNYQLIISDNDISGFWENGIDTGGHSEIMVLRNNIHSPKTPHAAGVNPVGMLLGANTNTGKRVMAIGNKITGLNQTNAVGINTRGGVRTLIMSNIIDDCWRGIAVGTAGASGAMIAHNTVVRTGAGNCIRISESNQNASIMNNIFHGSRIYDLSSAGTGCVRGGNILVGVNSADMNPPNVALVSPDHYFEELRDAINTRTFEPTPAVMRKMQARLNIEAVDALLSRYAIACAGAVNMGRIF